MPHARFSSFEALILQIITFLSTRYCVFHILRLQVRTLQSTLGNTSSAGVVDSIPSERSTYTQVCATTYSTTDVTLRLL